MKVLGWILLIWMVSAIVVTAFDSPIVIVIFLVICWLLRNVSWVDR